MKRRVKPEVSDGLGVLSPLERLKVTVKGMSVCTWGVSNPVRGGAEGSGPGAEGFRPRAPKRLNPKKTKISGNPFWSLTKSTKQRQAVGGGDLRRPLTAMNGPRTWLGVSTSNR